MSSESNRLYQLLKESTKLVVQETGFDEIEDRALDKLTAIMKSKTTQFAIGTRMMTEITGRSAPIPKDAFTGLRYAEIDIPSFITYAENIKAKRHNAAINLNLDILANRNAHKAKRKVGEEEVGNKHKEAGEQQKAQKKKKKKRAHRAKEFFNFEGMTFEELGFKETNNQQRRMDLTDSEDENMDDRQHDETPDRQLINFEDSGLHPTVIEVPVSSRDSNVSDAVPKTLHFMSNVIVRPDTFDLKAYEKLIKKSNADAEAPNRKPEGDSNKFDSESRSGSQRQTTSSNDQEPAPVLPSLKIRIKNPFYRPQPIQELQEEAETAVQKSNETEKEKDKENEVKIDEIQECEIRERKKREDDEYRQRKEEKKRRKAERREKQRLEEQARLLEEHKKERRRQERAEERLRKERKEERRRLEKREQRLRQEEKEEQLRQKQRRERRRQEKKEHRRREQELQERKDVNKKEEHDHRSSDSKAQNSSCSKTVGAKNEQESAEKLYFCPICSIAWCEDANMVGCDRCEEWFHWNCVGLKGEPTEATWFCGLCVKKREKKRRGSEDSQQSEHSTKRQKLD